MSRFKYIVVAKKWGTGGTVKKSQLSSVTIHHSAVKASTDTGYSAERRAKSYAAGHRKRGYPGIAYHIFIPYDASDNIYVTNFFDGHTWHNGNAAGNRDALAVLVDGNFEEEKPSVKQLLKLKQVLDDLYANWFSQNGWYAVDKHMNPRDNKIHRYTAGKNVRTLHYHNEVAQPGYGTACCGKYLIPYILEYRNNQGAVKWGKNKDTKMNTKKLQEKIDSLAEQFKEKGDEISALKKLNKELQNNVEQLNTQMIALKEAETLASRALSEANQQRSKLLKRNDELIKEVAVLNTQLGNMPIEDEPGKTFADIWNQLPTWVRYIAPNVAAILIPAVITFVTNLDIQEPEVLAGFGITAASIKSLIIGYLKKQLKKNEN